MKASIKNLKKKTPVKLRRIGNAMVAASVFVSASAMIGSYPKIAIGALIFGAVGKFITELFTDEQV